MAEEYTAWEPSPLARPERREMPKFGVYIQAIFYKEVEAVDARKASGIVRAAIFDELQRKQYPEADFRSVSNYDCFALESTTIPGDFLRSQEVSND